MGTGRSNAAAVITFLLVGAGVGLGPAQPATAAEAVTISLAPNQLRTDVRSTTEVSGQDLTVRPGGKITFHAPEHVALPDLMITSAGAGTPVDVPSSQLDQVFSADRRTLTVTVPASLPSTTNTLILGAETTDHVLPDIYTGSWDPLIGEKDGIDGELSAYGLKLSSTGPAAVSVPLIVRPTVYPAWPAGHTNGKFRPGTRITFTLPANDPYLSLFRPIDLRTATVSLFGYTEKQLQVTKAQNSIAYTIPGNVVGGVDATYYVPVISKTADAVVPVIEFSTGFEADRSTTPQHVAVSSPSGSGRVFKLATQNVNGGGTVRTVAFGKASDVPLMGDWDGDGHSTPGVWRPSTRTFYLRGGLGATAPVATVSFGRSSDLPVARTVGAGAGVGRTVVALFRPSAGTFYLASKNSGNGAPVTATKFGRTGDKPLLGDWNGNGSASPGVRRGTKVALKSDITGRGDLAYPVASGAQVFAGDWNGDGVTDFASRKGTKIDFTMLSEADAPESFSFGAAGDSVMAWTP